jgi:hypothetical protein
MGNLRQLIIRRYPVIWYFTSKRKTFDKKARLVAGGHMTKAPGTITYASVVFCETVCIALLMATLNDLNVKVGDVINAYITALITEKVWTVLGPEFGIDKVPSSCALYMDWRVLVLHFACT